MFLIQRYLFRQLLVSSLMSVGLFVVVLLVGNAIKDVFDLLASGFLSYGTFLRVMMRLMPSVIAYALPLGLLTGILLTLGRLSSQMEIVAMRAVGVGRGQIALPVFCIGLLGSLFALCVNLYYAPNAIRNYRITLENVARDNPTRFMQPRTFIHRFPGYIFYIMGERRGHNLENFWIWELDAQGRPHMLLKAKEGFFSHDKDHDALLLTLRNGSAEKRSTAPDAWKGGAFTTLTFEESSIRLPLDQIFGETNIGTYRKYSHMNLGALLEALEEQKYNPDPEQRFQQEVRIRLEIQKNVAMAASVLILALVAIPLGIKFSRAETFFNIGLAVALGLSYYFLVILLSWLERNPHYRPDLLVWIPNLLYIALGFTFFKRFTR